MNYNNNNNIQTAKIVKKRFSIIWIIPIIALSLALYIGYQSWENRGHILEIEFSSASGIEIGKTKVKYKDVEIGKVIGLSLTQDLRKVVVKVALERNIANKIHEDSSFWVVRPKVTTRMVSGIGTLLSGAYISLSIGEKGHLKKYVIGLDEAPIISDVNDGKKFILEAERLGSTDIGSPIFYKGMAVGEVISYKLLDNDKMNIYIYIRSPYDKIVNSKTAFWNVNGLDFRFGSNGIEAQLESFLSLMQGGIAFENLSANGLTVPNETKFQLYHNKETITKIDPKNKILYLMLFKDGISGLQEGAKIKHKGLEVGVVKKIEPRFNNDKLSVEIPVIVEIWPERLSIYENNNSLALIEQMIIKKGLRAKLKPANFLTGQMEIDLTFVNITKNNQQVLKIKQDGDYAMFPTVETDFEQLLQRVDSLVAKLENAPINDILNEFHETIINLNKIININNRDSVVFQSGEILKKLNKTLENMDELPHQIKLVLKNTETAMQKLSKTLETGEKNLRDDSLIQHDIRSLLKEVSRASIAIEGLADTLQRKPNSIIFGKD